MPIFHAEGESLFINSGRCSGSAGQKQSGRGTAPGRAGLADPRFQKISLNKKLRYNASTKKRV
jgi:hypothetical protein